MLLVVCYVPPAAGEFIVRRDCAEIVDMLAAELCRLKAWAACLDTVQIAKILSCHQDVRREEAGENVMVIPSPSVRLCTRAPTEHIWHRVPMVEVWCISTHEACRVETTE